MSYDDFGDFCDNVASEVETYNEFSPVQFYVHGDDSIRNDFLPESIAADVGAMFGWEVTMEAGVSWNVQYLSRCRLGTKTFARVRRALIKYHLSASVPGVNKPERGLLASKSLSYMATDYYTPLLGAVAWAHFNRNKEELSPKFSRPFKERLGLCPIALDDLAQKGPPPLDMSLTALVAYESGIPGITIAQKHLEWVAYGLGGDLPSAINTLIEGKADMFIM